MHCLQLRSYDYFYWFFKTKLGMFYREISFPYSENEKLLSQNFLDEKRLSRLYELEESPNFLLRTYGHDL